jgi:exonuclease III
MTNWIKKEDLTICLQETHVIGRSKHWLRVKGWKKIYQANGPWEQAGIAILISDKTSNLHWSNKEGHFILIKGTLHQKEVTIINLYAPNVSAPNFIKHTLKDLKAHIHSNIVVVGDFNIPLSPIDRSSKQKIKDNRVSPLRSIWSQCIKTRMQQQKQQQKTHK